MFQSILAAVSYYFSGTNAALTPEQIDLVQESWKNVSKDKEKAGLAFYNRLFTENPEVVELFSFGKSSQDEEGKKFQGVKLMNMIGTAVIGLDDLDTIIPAIKKLGTRHKKYGVEQRHFKPVGDALIWVLQESQGEQFTAEHVKAWAIVYQLVTDTMIEGMKEA